MAVKRTSQRKHRKRIALDFDGVLHTYSKKWHDGTIYDVPTPGSVAALQLLARDYDLVIFTCRPSLLDVEEWVKENYGLDIPVTAEKPHADLYIDDRGFRFEGDWEEVVKLAPKLVKTTWNATHTDRDRELFEKFEEGREAASGSGR